MAGSVLDLSFARTAAISFSKSATLSGRTVLNSKPTGAVNVRAAMAVGAGATAGGRAPGTAGTGGPGAAGCCADTEAIATATTAAVAAAQPRGHSPAAGRVRALLVICQSFHKWRSRRPQTRRATNGPPVRGPGLRSGDALSYFARSTASVPADRPRFEANAPRYNS